MPYKSGKLKGQLTTAELRKLIKAHNVLYTIKVPKGATQPDMVKLINKNGYSVNHKTNSLILRMKNLPRKITTADIPKKKEPTLLEKQKKEEKKQEKIEKEKKKVRDIKKEAIAGEKDRQKKKPKKEKDKVKPNEAKFKLPSQTPKPVVISKDKKPPKIDKSYKIVKINKTSYPLNVNQYPEIRNIPVEDIWSNLVTKGSNIFYPWSSISSVSDIMFFHIIKDNKIKCIPPVVSKMCEYIGKENKLDAYGKKISKEVEVSGEKKKVDVKSSAWICRPNDFIKKYAGQYAKRYLECKKKKEPVAIPITKSGKRDRTSTHANMLILNPYLNTAEHFEPHGEEYRGQRLIDKKTGKSKKFVPEQSSLKTGIDAINRELKRLGSKDKLKYMPMKDVCPKDPEAFFNGLQSGDKYREKEPKLFEGVVITERKGYCQMWSLFFMDTRMKTLEQPANEVMKNMLKMANDLVFKEDNKLTNQQYIQLMRGMSKYAWEQLQEVLKQPYNTEGITKDNLIKYLDGKTITERRGVEIALENLTVKLISEITKGEAFEDDPIDKKVSLGWSVKTEEKPLDIRMYNSLVKLWSDFLKDIKANSNVTVYKRYDDLYKYITLKENMLDKPVKKITKRKSISDALKFIKELYKNDNDYDIKPVNELLRIF